MKFLQLFAHIILLIFSKPAPKLLAPPVPVETVLPDKKPDKKPEIKPEIDPEIFKAKDCFVTDVFGRFKQERDYDHGSLDSILKRWAGESCAGRRNLERAMGVRLPCVQMHGVAFIAGRVETFYCTFEFIDEDERTCLAVPRREDVEKLKDLDKRLKRFLN